MLFLHRMNRDALKKAGFAEFLLQFQQINIEMNMLGHEFYMFRNADTDDVNVVYKRADGGYGILEPTEG